MNNNNINMDDLYKVLSDINQNLSDMVAIGKFNSVIATMDLDKKYGFILEPSTLQEINRMAQSISGLDEPIAKPPVDLTEETEETMYQK